MKLQSTKLTLVRPCALCICMLVGLLACAGVPERDFEADLRDVENQNAMRPADLNKATSNPAEGTILAWLAQLESPDVNVFSRAKTRLLPHKELVAAYLKRTWLNPLQNIALYRPYSDDATQTAIEFLMGADAQKATKDDAWKRLLIREIRSWFGVKAEERKSLLLLRGLDWLWELQGTASAADVSLYTTLMRRPEPELRWKSATILLNQAKHLNRTQVIEILKGLGAENYAVRRDAGRFALELWANTRTGNTALSEERLTFNPDGSLGTRRIQAMALERWAEGYFPISRE